LNGKQITHFDPKRPFLVNNNGGNDTSFLQRSLLANWNLEVPSHDADFVNLKYFKDLNGIPSQLTITGTLRQLYKVAYIGKKLDWLYGDSVFYRKYRCSPILEIRDTSRFVYDFGTGKNIFTYSQIVPAEKRTFDNMQEIMKRDLQNFFGYEVSVESRMMPYLKLVATDKAMKKVKTKGDSSSYQESFAGLTYINMPIEYMIRMIVYDNYLVSRDLPIIDETGITGNIDIKLDAAMTGLNSVTEGLRKHGLDLVKGEKMMKVIVIRDAK
jgi:hypothetical protein